MHYYILDFAHLLCNFAATMNWDDLKFILHISRCGQLSAAARQLNVNQTTVSRRLLNFENQLGQPVFTRLNGHFQPTTFGQQLIAIAVDLDKHLYSLDRFSHSIRFVVSGTVRITTVTGLANTFIIPALAKLYSAYPHLRIEITSGNSSLNLTHREADIAIRMARPTTGNFLMRKLCDVGYGIFSNTAARKPLNNADQQWVCLDDHLSHIPEMQWLQSNHPKRNVVLKVDDTDALISAVKAGVGIAILPYFMAAKELDLYCLSTAVPLLQREFWLLVHNDVQSTERFKVTSDWLFTTFQLQARYFSDLSNPLCDD